MQKRKGNVVVLHVALKLIKSAVEVGICAWQCHGEMGDRTAVTRPISCRMQNFWSHM